MLRLHGFASSNYHNIVKLVLLEKRLEFEEVTTYPPADEALPDLLDALPAVRRHREMMGERESLKRVKADRRDDVPRFARHRSGVSGGA